MLSAGFVIDHRSWAPGRKTDITPAALAADRAWTPATQEDNDMPLSDADLAKIGTLIDQRINLVLRGDPTTDPSKDTHNDNLGQIRKDMQAGFAGVNGRLDQLSQPAPPPAPGT